MPRFDGTGPTGAGPMTGRGEGYCALELPESDRPVRACVGLENTPVRIGAPAARPARWPLMSAWQRPGLMFGRAWAARGRRGRQRR